MSQKRLKCHKYHYCHKLSQTHIFVPTTIETGNNWVNKPFVPPASRPQKFPLLATCNGVHVRAVALIPFFLDIKKSRLISQATRL